MHAHKPKFGLRSAPTPPRKSSRARHVEPVKHFRGVVAINFFENLWRPLLEDDRYLGRTAGDIYVFGEIITDKVCFKDRLNKQTHLSFNARVKIWPKTQVFLGKSLVPSNRAGKADRPCPVMVKFEISFDLKCLWSNFNTREQLINSWHQLQDYGPFKWTNI